MDIFEQADAIEKILRASKAEWTKGEEILSAYENNRLVDVLRRDGIRFEMKPDNAMKILDIIVWKNEYPLRYETFYRKAVKK